MKRKLPALLVAAMFAFAGTACEGPVGPKGDPGADGADGVAGPEGPRGPAGENALNTCSDCHDSDPLIVAIEAQYERSGHGTSLTFERDSGPLDGGCNMCHTSQGFTAAVVDGEPMDDINQPAPINCRTCHEIHETFTEADYALVTTAPVDLLIPEGATIDIEGNICANCHQAREDDGSMVDLETNADVNTSRYWGPHYGVQSGVVSATVAFEELQPSTGAITVPTDPMGVHFDIGCTGCHMQEPYGAQAGGHTWWMSYSYHGGPHLLDQNGTCTDCHTNVTTKYYGADPTVDGDFNPVIAGDVDGSAEETLETLAEIRTLLQAYGILADESHATGETMTSEYAAALWNYQVFYHDGSYGVHHKNYTNAILANTLAWLQENPRTPATE